jgi:hypothetical protein
MVFLFRGLVFYPIPMNLFQSQDIAGTIRSAIPAINTNFGFIDGFLPEYSSKRAGFRAVMAANT